MTIDFDANRPGIVMLTGGFNDNPAKCSRT
jgi:hypothetical protein